VAGFVSVLPVAVEASAAVTSVHAWTEAIREGEGLGLGEGLGDGDAVDEDAGPAQPARTRAVAIAKAPINALIVASRKRSPAPSD